MRDELDQTQSDDDPGQDRKHDLSFCRKGKVTEDEVSHEVAATAEIDGNSPSSAQTHQGRAGFSSELDGQSDPDSEDHRPKDPHVEGAAGQKQTQPLHRAWGKYR